MIWNECDQVVNSDMTGIYLPHQPSGQDTQFLFWYETQVKGSPAVLLVAYLTCSIDFLALFGKLSQESLAKEPGHKLL